MDKRTCEMWWNCGQPATWRYIDDVSTVTDVMFGHLCDHCLHELLKVLGCCRLINLEPIS